MATPLKVIFTNTAGWNISTQCTISFYENSIDWALQTVQALSPIITNNHTMKVQFSIVINPISNRQHFLHCSTPNFSCQFSILNSLGFFGIIFQMRKCSCSIGWNVCFQIHSHFMFSFVRFILVQINKFLYGFNLLHYVHAHTHNHIST